MRCLSYVKQSPNKNVKRQQFNIALCVSTCAAYVLCMRLCCAKQQLLLYCIFQYGYHCTRVQHKCTRSKCTYSVCVHDEPSIYFVFGKKNL